VLESNLISLALDIAEESITPLEEQDLLTEGKYKSREGTQYKDLPPTPPYIAEAAGAQSSPAPSIIGESDEGQKKRQGVMAEDTVRVHITLLNDLLNLASEMVLERNQLLRILKAHRKEIPGLNAVLQNIEEVTTELQEKIRQTCM